MELGTWGEWAGAIGTTAATVVALGLGLRDEDARRQRNTARRTVHAAADELLVDLDRREDQMDEWDGGDAMTTMLGRASECQPIYSAAAELGAFRRWRALRLLTRLYGAEVVRYLRVARGPLDLGSHDAAKWFLADPQRLHDASRRIPLRQSGARDEARQRDRASLRRVVRRLTRV